MKIGVIADDFTGATDVAVALRRNGLRTLIGFGALPDTAGADCDAVVVGLKSRTVSSAEAVAASESTARQLLAQGAERLYFKYCSTFDSTEAGNIGPVLEALATLTDARIVLTTPSSPEHGRTQYLGILFVGGVPLAESPMRHHPLTPMTDSNLVRVLSRQTSRPVAVVPLDVVRRGADAIRGTASTSGAVFLLVDATEPVDLLEVARAVRSDRLVAGAAGLAGALGAVLAEGLDIAGPAETHDVSAGMPAAVLAGSCSARTLEQIDVMIAAGRPVLRLDPRSSQDPQVLAGEGLRWFDSLTSDDAPLIYWSLPPQELSEVQRELGVQHAADVLEEVAGLLAVGLVERGVRRLVTAGGETSGAVVAALGVTGGVVGHEEAPGVPWIHTGGDVPMGLLLKSGNFGQPDFLVEASR